MGAGEFDAGVDDIAGEDPLPAISPPRDVTPPAALLYDGATRAHPLDADGRYLGIHPVDQRVALALLVTLGSVSSVPGLGSGLRKIKKITRKTPAEVRNAVDLALADLVDAKDIEVRRVDIEVRGAPTGGFAVAVSYVNKRLTSSKPRTFRTP